MLGRKQRHDGLTAVVASQAGDHVASVVHDRGGKPRVTFLKTLPDRGSVAELRRILERGKANRFAASALMDRDDYQLLLVEAPDVRPEELRAAVRWRIKDLISFHIDDAVIDVFEIPDQRHANRNRMMYAVAARAQRVSAKANALDSAGLDATFVDIPEMAVRNLAMLLPEESRGVALVHLVADGGFITISRQGTLYLTRRLDVGAQALQDADDAERDGLCESVLLEVQRSLDYYESHFPHGPVAALALTQTAAATALAEFLPRLLETPVISPRLEDLLEFETDPLMLDGDDILAIGAALRHEERVL